MSENMKNNVLKIVYKAFTRYNEGSDQVKFIKDAFDDTYGEDWHCIIGEELGVAITPLDGSYAFVTHNDQQILLFKA